MGDLQPNQSQTMTAAPPGPPCQALAREPVLKKTTYLGAN